MMTTAPIKRTCVFCGLPARMTKEHAIPQWVSKDLGVIRVDAMSTGQALRAFEPYGCGGVPG